MSKQATEEKLKFHYFGHAGVKITNQSESITIDPWFGCPFNGQNMVAYPPIPVPQASKVECSAIHISHVHLDHFCRDALSHFSTKTPIVIGKYPTDYFRQRLLKLGFSDVREISENGLEIGPFRIHCYPLKPFDGSFDSLLIVESAGKKIILNNDCILSETEYDLIQKKFGSINYGFLGYSIVSPYPICYSMTDTDVDTLLLKTQSQALKHIVQLDKIFHFQKIIPYANGIRLNSATTIHCNIAFNRHDLLKNQFPDYISQKLYLAEPDQTWDETFHPQPMRYSYSPQDIASYFIQHKNLYAFTKTELLPDESYIHFLTDYFRRVEKTRNISIHIVCCLTNSSQRPLAAFSFKDGETHKITIEKMTGLAIKLEIPCCWMNEVILGKMTMGSLYYSFEFKAHYPEPIVPFVRRVHRWI